MIPNQTELELAFQVIYGVWLIVLFILKWTWPVFALKLAVKLLTYFG